MTIAQFLIYSNFHFVFLELSPYDKYHLLSNFFWSHDSHNIRYLLYCHEWKIPFKTPCGLVKDNGKFNLHATICAEEDKSTFWGAPARIMEAAAATFVGAVSYVSVHCGTGDLLPRRSRSSRVELTTSTIRGRGDPEEEDIGPTGSRNFFHSGKELRNYREVSTDMHENMWTRLCDSRPGTRTIHAT